MFEFDLKLFGSRLSAARKEKGLSRDDLGKILYLTKDAIAKWEQGVNAPRIPEVFSLSKILDKPLEFFIEGEERNMITQNQLIIDQHASKPMEFIGATEVLNGWNTYFNEYDTICLLEEKSEKETNWKDTNIFLNFINTKSKEIYAIRDFGMYLPDATNYLFKTELLPLYTHQPTSSESELLDVANRTLELFNSEVDAMKAAGEYPVFLMHYCGTNNYIAWSITEGKEIYIFDYKQYLPSFSYGEIDIHNIEDIVENDKYTIIPPSQQLIEALGLTLYPSIWEGKMAWDEWAPRSPKECKSDIIPAAYLDLYNSAIIAINKSRCVDLGYDEAFAKLESRTARFERLCVLGAPAEIIEKEANLIQKAYTMISHIMV